MFPLFETIRVENGQIMHSSWHEERFATSYLNYFKKTPPFTLFQGIEVPETFNSGLVKLRIAYDEQERHIHFEKYHVQSLSKLKLVSGDDISYSLKFSDRNALLALSFQKGNCDDILICKQGFLTDTLYCNIVFFDGVKWVTPSQPLLAGTARARLLSSGEIFTDEIKVSDLSRFRTYKLINAMRDFENVEEHSVEGIEF